MQHEQVVHLRAAAANHVTPRQGTPVTPGPPVTGEEASTDRRGRPRRGDEPTHRRPGLARPTASLSSSRCFSAVDSGVASVRGRVVRRVRADVAQVPPGLVDDGPASWRTSATVRAGACPTRPGTRTSRPHGTANCRQRRPRDGGYGRPVIVADVSSRVGRNRGRVRSLRPRRGAPRLCRSQHGSDRGNARSEPSSFVAPSCGGDDRSVAVLHPECLGIREGDGVSVIDRPRAHRIPSRPSRAGRAA